MRKTMLVVLLALAGCKGNSTATDGMMGGGGRTDLVPSTASPATLAETRPLAVPSVRRVVPGLYAVRVAVESGPVTLIVRQTSGSGWPALTSGSEVIRFHDTGMAETQVATTPGYRYLVLAVPGESDPMLLDYTLASFAEIVP